MDSFWPCITVLLEFESFRERPILLTFNLQKEVVRTESFQKWHLYHSFPWNWRSIEIIILWEGHFPPLEPAYIRRYCVYQIKMETKKKRIYVLCRALHTYIQYTCTVHNEPRFWKKTVLITNEWVYWCLLLCHGGISIYHLRLINLML